MALGTEMRGTGGTEKWHCENADESRQGRQAEKDMALVALKNGTICAKAHMALNHKVDFG